MKIVIVGGGTAGWSVAATLTTLPSIDVQIIEPKDIPIIGVGESTIPFINEFHSQIGMPFDKDWLSVVDGTMKFGILFTDYFEKGKSWFHPFVNRKDILICETIVNSTDISFEIPQEEFFYKNYSFGKKIDNGYTPPSDEVIKNRRAGYHINAIKYAELLKTKTLERNNISLSTSSVQEVILNDNGDIDHLIMSDGQMIEGDLYIDCTGFRAILANKIQNEWISLQDRLLVDNAIVAQLPYIDREKQEVNYTYCHALDAGWCWSIPLQNRVGVGYNYSSQHTSYENACREFQDHLKKLYGYEDVEFRNVPYNAGYRQKGWKNNVICMGLSGFFMEPIEATAIALMHNHASTLRMVLEAEYIPWKSKIKRFNQVFEESALTTTEFIEVHYLFTKRDDTSFWKHYKEQPLTALQDSILEHYVNKDLEYSKKKISSLLPNANIFSAMSYMFLFTGAGIMPNQIEGAELKKSYK